MARTLIHVPRSVRRGEAFEVRTTIAHPMETGYRPDEAGRVVPRDIVRRLSCTLDGEPVFSAELFPAIAANPLRRLPGAGRAQRPADHHLGG